MTYTLIIVIIGRTEIISSPSSAFGVDLGGRAREDSAFPFLERENFDDLSLGDAEEILVGPDPQEQNEQERKADGHDNKGDSPFVTDFASDEQVAHIAVEQQRNEKEERVHSAPEPALGYFFAAALGVEVAVVVDLHLIILLADLAFQLLYFRVSILQPHGQKFAQAAFVREHPASTQAELGVRAGLQANPAAALGFGPGLVDQETHFGDGLALLVEVDGVQRVLNSALIHLWQPIINDKKLPLTMNILSTPHSSDGDVTEPNVVVDSAEFVEDAQPAGQHLHILQGSPQDETF